ncbi:MAG: hypothetical protein E7480_04670 [Ruminococcaceae bacterium]|nr:hypothetical protein [Oscillospiraceae bacterium]
MKKTFISLVLIVAVLIQAVTFISVFAVTETANVTGVRSRVQGNYYILDIDTDKALATDQVVNLQASADAAIKTAVREKIYINGKAVGEGCTLAGHDYAAMVSINQNGICIWIDLQNVFNITISSDANIEIKEGLELGGYNIGAVKYNYTASTTLWAKAGQPSQVPTDTVNITGLKPIDVASDPNYIFFQMYFDKNVQADYAHMQASSDATLKALVGSCIIINGKSVSQALTEGGDYEVMIHTENNGAHIAIWTGLTNKVSLSTTADAVVIVKEGLVINGYKVNPVKCTFTAQSATWAVEPYDENDDDDDDYDDNNGGGTIPPPVVTDMSPVSVSEFMVSESHIYFEIDFDNSANVELYQLQNSTDSEYVNYKDKMFINGKSVGEAMEDTGDQYVAMLHIIKGGSALSVWMGASNPFNAGLDKKTVFRVVSGVTANGIKIKPFKCTFDPETKLWTAELTAENEDASNDYVEDKSVKITSVSKFTDTDDPNFKKITVTLSKSIGTVEGNIQASTKSELEELKNSIRKNIILNGKSIDKLCTDSGDNYKAMIHFSANGDSFDIWVSASNDFSWTADNNCSIEIKPQLTVNGYTFEAQLFNYSASSREWGAGVVSNPETSDNIIYLSILASAIFILFTTIMIKQKRNG